MFANEVRPATPRTIGTLFFSGAFGTGVGLGSGVAAGVTTVGFRTRLPDWALMLKAQIPTRISKVTIASVFLRVRGWLDWFIQNSNPGSIL